MPLIRFVIGLCLLTAAPTVMAAPPAQVGPEARDAKEAQLWNNLRQLQATAGRGKGSVFRPFAAVKVPGLKHETRALIRQRNLVGSNFVISAVRYKLDGVMLLATQGERLRAQPTFTLLDERVTPGVYVLDAEIELKGRDMFGIFTYMNGYKVRLSASHKVRFEGGKSSFVEIRVVDSGGSNLKRRFSLAFDDRSRR